jgi:hypothetical protein
MQALADPAVAWRPAWRERALAASVPDVHLCLHGLGRPPRACASERPYGSSSQHFVDLVERARRFTGVDRRV